MNKKSKMQKKWKRKKKRRERPLLINFKKELRMFKEGMKKQENLKSINLEKTKRKVEIIQS